MESALLFGAGLVLVSFAYLTASMTINLIRAAGRDHVDGSPSWFVLALAAGASTFLLVSLAVCAFTDALS